MDNSYAGVFAALGIFLFFLIAIFIAIVVLVVVGRWKLFQKAGKNGWEAIIPFYTDWVYVEIAGLNPWWFVAVIASSILTIIDSEHLSTLGYIISFVGLFFCNYNISKKLHKDTGFAVLMTIFPYVMLPLIGFSDNYKWDSNVEVSPNGPINSNNNNNNSSTNNEDVKFCPHCGGKVPKDSKFCSSCGKEI